MAAPCRVLVVEDDPGIQDLLGAVFSDLAFQVEVAGDSTTAREQIRLDGFDLVIIDITLPGGEDGFSLAQRAAATPMGVILISGYEAAYESMKRSGHAYLLKPFRLDELVALSIEVMTKMGVQCAPHTPKSEEVAHR